MKKEETTILSFEFVDDNPDHEEEGEDGKLVIRSVHPEFRVDGEQKEILKPVTLIDHPVFIDGDAFPTYAVPRKDKNGEMYAIILTDEEISKIFKQEFKRRVFAEHFEHYVEEEYPDKDPDDLAESLNCSEMSEAFYRALVFNDDSCNDWYAERMNEWIKYHIDDYEDVGDDDDEEDEEK